MAASEPRPHCAIERTVNTNFPWRIEMSVKNKHSAQQPQAAHTRWVALGAMALALGLSACASFAPQTPEEAVKQRAQVRWNSLLKGDLDKAYGYFTPAYRGLTPLDQYKASVGGGAVWKGAEVVLVTCEPEKCMARVRIDAHPVATLGFGRGPISTHVDETWLLDQGQWWLYQK